MRWPSCKSSRPVRAGRSPAAPVAAAAPNSDVQAQVKGWAAAWAAKDYNSYSGFYASTFTPDGGLSREDWAQLRRSRISTRENISVELQDVNVRMDGSDRAQVSFRQIYQSNVTATRRRKVLEMINVGGKWLINRESSVPCGGSTSGGCRSVK